MMKHILWHADVIIINILVNGWREHHLCQWWNAIVHLALRWCCWSGRHKRCPSQMCRIDLYDSTTPFHTFRIFFQHVLQINIYLLQNDKHENGIYVCFFLAFKKRERVSVYLWSLHRHSDSIFVNNFAWFMCQVSN